MGTWPLIGRSVELGALLSAAADPAVRAVVMSGPDGIGKTALLDELARRAGAAGHEVARVRATMSAATMPLAAVQALLPDEGGHASQRELVAAAVSAVRRRHQRAARRLVVTVDDAHLLDDASATLVHALCSDGGPLLVVTVRAGEPAPDAVAALWKDFDAEPIELPPLSAAEVAALLTGALGGPVEGRSVRRVSRVSAGNPLLVREIVRAARRAGGPTRDVDGLWRLPEPPPRSWRLEQIVGERVGVLSREARSVVEALASTGPLALELLMRLAGRPAVGEAEAAGLIVVLTDGRRQVVQLSHPLYAEVLSVAQPRVRAQDLYARLADILVAVGLRRRGDLAQLARWQLAAGTLPDRAALVEAVAAASAQGDHPSALELAGLLETQVETSPEMADGIPDEVQREAQDGCRDETTNVMRDEAQAGVDQGGSERRLEYKLAAACARSALWLGRTSDSDRYFARAMAAAPPAARGALLVGRAYNVFLGAGRVTAAADLLDAAARAGAPPGAIAALRALFLVSGGRIAEALVACDAVVDTERSMAAARVSTLTWSGRAGDAVSVALAAEGLHPVPGAPRHALEATTCTALAVHDGLADAERRAQRGYAEALDGPDLGAQAMWAFALGHLLLWWGRPAAAAPLLTEAATTMTSRPTGLGPAAHLQCLGSLAEARALLGDVPGAERALAQADLVPTGDCVSAALDAGRAWTLAARGDREAARALLRDTAAASERLGNRLAAGRALLDLARLGDREAAARLVHAASGLQGRLPAGWAAYAAALLEPADEAVDALERIGLPLLAGEAALAAVATSGSATGSSAGPAAALRWAARGSRLLDRLAVVATWLDPRPALPQLTRREVEVARLVATGRSSRAVAEALHLSVRTVDSHLAHVYRKLAVHSRQQLAATLLAFDTAAPDAPPHAPPPPPR